MSRTPDRFRHVSQTSCDRANLLYRLSKKWIVGVYMMIETPNCTPPIRPDFTRRRPFEKVAANSLVHQFQEASVVLAHLARLFERPRALNLKAPKVALDVPHVDLKVAADEIDIVPRGLRIAWHERPGRRQQDAAETSPARHATRSIACAMIDTHNLKASKPLIFLIKCMGTVYSSIEQQSACRIKSLSCAPILYHRMPGLQHLKPGHSPYWRT